MQKMLAQEGRLVTQEGASPSELSELASPEDSFRAAYSFAQQQPIKLEQCKPMPGVQEGSDKMLSNSFPGLFSPNLY